MIQWKKSSRSANGGGGCIEVGWKKSSRSTGNGECVEVCTCNDILVRDTKDRNGPVLSFSRNAWASFIGGIKNNEPQLQ